MLRLLNAPIKYAARGILLKAPEAREPRTGRQPTTTEADVRPLRSFIGASLPARGIAALRQY